MDVKENGLTKDSSGRDGFSVQPERHLREDDGHDAGQIRLDHKVANFPLQVEVSGHDHVLSYGGRMRVKKPMNPVFYFIYCLFIGLVVPPFNPR